jgi:HSP20 family protein
MFDKEADMAVNRRSPSGQLASLQSDMARMMNTFFGSAPFAGVPNGASVWLPPVDISETDEALLLSFDLPGLAEDDIQVELDDNVLTVSGERGRKHEVKQDDYFRYERRFGSFSRSVALPAGVKDSQIEASYENGVLEIRVPKPEQHKPKRIQVGPGSGGTIEGTGTRKEEQGS